MHAQSLPSSLAEELPSGSAAPVTAYLEAGPHLTVPILYYHYIRTVDPTRDLLGFKLSIAPTLFAQQMALLHVDGAHTVTMTQVVAALAGTATLPAHPVVLTFDDGYSDFATAAEPVLARFGFVAIDYVVSGFVGRFHYMTAAQVVAMDAAGMVIGSHTAHHVDLAAVPLDRARREIDSGKAALEGLLGHPVLDFAYPFGGHDAAVVQLVEQAGFRDAVSTMYGDRQALSSLFLLHRTEVGGTPTLAAFAHDAALQPPSPAQVAMIGILVPAVVGASNDAASELSRAV